MILVRLTARCKFALIVKRLMFIYFNLTYFVCSVSQHVHVYNDTYVVLHVHVHVVKVYIILLSS